MTISQISDHKTNVFSFNSILLREMNNYDNYIYVKRN